MLRVSLAAMIMTVGSDNRKRKRQYDQSIEFICYCPLLEARKSLRARAHDISIYFRLTHSGRSDSDADTFSRDPPGATEGYVQSMLARVSALRGIWGGR